MRTTFDRAAVVIGVGGVLSVLFALTTSSDNNFVKVGGTGLLVFLVLGLLAIAGGLSGLRPLVLAAGGLFVLAAIVQLVQFGRSTNWLDGNGSTFALLLAWGLGLLVVGFAGRVAERE